MQIIIEIYEEINNEKGKKMKKEYEVKMVDLVMMEEGKK